MRGAIPDSDHDSALSLDIVYNNTWDQTSLYLAMNKLQSNKLRDDDERRIDDTGYADEQNLIIVPQERQS